MPDSEKALLFDIDGTLTDTDALHLEAFNEVLGPHGHVFDHARFTRELQGFSNASISERFLADQPPERQTIIMGEKEQAFRKLVAGRIQPLPGLIALVTSFVGMFIGQAVRTRMDPDTFRRWFLIAMIFLGIYLVGSAIYNIERG